MIDHNEPLENVTLSFMTPPDQGAAPTWHLFGKAQARTSVGPRMHGAVTAYGLAPIVGAVRQELELFADGALVWRLDKGEEGSFVGPFQLAEGARFTPGEDGFWQISLVAVAPITRERDDAEELDESPAHHERLERIAGRVNEGVSKLLHQAIESRASDLSFFDAFAAVNAGALDAILRVIAAAIPDEALSAEVVREGVIQTIDELLPTIIAERQGQPSEGRSVSARPEAPPPTCQMCGGEIAGWLCQKCPAEFRENDAGVLILDFEAPAEGAGEDAAWMWLNGHVECDPADRDYSADEMVDAFMAGQSAALRARSSAPEAREEALGNLLAVIHGDGGHRALEVGTKQAALEAEKIVAGLFAAPSADKLRIAVEALEPFANLGVSSGPDDEPCHYAYRITRGAIRNARQALAALKAEGGK